MLCADPGQDDAVKVTSMRGRGIVLVAILLVINSFGCQSTRSWSQGCPGVYSGVKFYQEQIDEVPMDGRIFFTLDLPFTLIADTLALPVTAFAEPKSPPGGYPVGCKWARKTNGDMKRDNR